MKRDEVREIRELRPPGGLTIVWQADLDSLQAENEALRAVLKDCVDSWGDYSPVPQSKAAKALKKAKEILNERN